jgi:hypothetical protein
VRARFFSGVIMQETIQLNMSDVAKAVQQAQATLNASDACVDQMARLIAGRLRKSDVSGYVLKQLKKELAAYNIHTNTWKSER